MYPYHNKIKQRIRAGELVDHYFTEDYPGIGEALVLVFSTAPFERPIRPPTGVGGVRGAFKEGTER